MANWTLRRAEQGDAVALAACIDAAYAQYATHIPDLPAVSADCAEEIAEHQVWVADVNAAVVGGLVMVPEDGFMRVANIAVHPDHRGGGLGRTLIALAETEASRQGFGELRLTTHVDMPENIRLYRHLGWAEDRRHGNKVSMIKTI